MTFLDLFAGIGGFRRGMELAGHTCVGFCECDKFAVASYISMHCITDEQRKYLDTLDLKQRQKEILKEEYRNGEWYADDIKTIDSSTMPRADCWCFGFPCQDISIAGRQLGFAGSRSSLFFGTTKLISELEEEHRPKYLFIENVKNLLSVNGGLDFARMFVELDDIGYDAEWQVLNSKDFGVPQNRERVFIIGHLRGQSTTTVFPVEGSYGENSIHQIGKLKDTNRDNSNRHRVYDTDGIAPTIGKMDGGGLEPNVPMFCDMNSGGLNTTDESRTITSRYDSGVGNRNGEHSRIAIPILTPDREEKRQNGRRCKENGEDMFTITSQDRHGVGVSIEPIGSANWHVSESYQSGIMEDVSGAITACPNNAVAFEIKSVRGDMQEHQSEREDGVSPTLTSAMGTGGGHIPMLSLEVKENIEQDTDDSLEPIGGVCTDMSPEFQTDIMDGMSRSLKADNHDASVALKVKNGTKQEYNEFSDSKNHKSRVDESVAQTLDTSSNQGTMVRVDDDLEVYAVWSEKYQCHIAIRKLTPKECFRLQGWTDDYFEKAQFVNSDSQLYKEAGNGVTVNVIEAMASKMSV